MCIHWHALVKGLHPGGGRCQLRWTLTSEGGICGWHYSNKNHINPVMLAGSIFDRTLIVAAYRERERERERGRGQGRGSERKRERGGRQTTDKPHYSLPVFFLFSDGPEEARERRNRDKGISTCVLSLGTHSPIILISDLEPRVVVLMFQTVF